jgi:hypothetical protein
VTQAEDALAIAFRTGLPFVGLRDHAHDPDLDRLVPPDAARTARAIPLTADDDRIRLAVADPDTDLSTLDRYLAGRQVDLALAPREEIDTILGPPPAPGEEPPEAATGAAEDAPPPEAAPSEFQPDPVTDTEALAAAPGSLIADPDPQPLGEAEPEAVAAEGTAPTDAVETEVEPSAEPQPLVADQEREGVGDPKAPVGEEAAATEHAPPVPEPIAAESRAEPIAAESPGEPVAAEAGPQPVAADGAEPIAAEAAPEPVAAEAGPRPVAAEAAPEPDAAEAATEPVVAEAQAEHADLSDVDAELAGEVPSWLEPRRRRWWRVVLAVLIVLVVLALAAVAVVAFVNA